MKILRLSIVVSCLVAQLGVAGELKWLNSEAEAQKVAKQEKKIILLDFTGSDWCGWCIRLKREVFETKEFIQFATNNVVLVEVDFPKTRELSEEQKRANIDLAMKYKVQGFPTLVVTDSEGKQLGEMSYQPGGPQPFITRLGKFKARAVR